MSGFVYVMSNPSLSGRRIKIGKSKSDPSAFRKDELYSTGVPEPFEIEYFAFVDEHDATESLVHKKLDEFRPNKKREFFTCSIPHAILTIQQNSKIKYEEILYKSPEEIEEEKKKQLKASSDQKRLDKWKQREAEKKHSYDLAKDKAKQEKKKDDLKKEIQSWSPGVAKFILWSGLAYGQMILTLLVAMELPTNVGLFLFACSVGLCFYLHKKYLF